MLPPFSTGIGAAVSSQTLLVLTTCGNAADAGSLASLLVELFAHHHWANLQTAAACANLTDAQLDSTVPGTAGTIRDTLMHIAGAEQRYLLRLARRQPAYGERDGWPGAAHLQQTLDESGRLLIDLA